MVMSETPFFYCSATPVCGILHSKERKQEGVVTCVLTKGEKVLCK